MICLISKYHAVVPGCMNYGDPLPNPLTHLATVSILCPPPPNYQFTFHWHCTRRDQWYLQNWQHNGPCVLPSQYNLCQKCYFRTLMNHQLILMIYFSVSPQPRVPWQDVMTVLMDFPPQDTKMVRRMYTNLLWVLNLHVE